MKAAARWLAVAALSAALLAVPVWQTVDRLMPEPWHPDGWVEVPCEPWMGPDAGNCYAPPDRVGPTEPSGSWTPPDWVESAPTTTPQD